MIYKNTMISAVTIMTVLFAVWITLAYQAKTPAPIQNTREPDTEMENVISIILDKQGKPKLKIVTAKLIHYAESNTTHLTSPYIVMYRQSPKPWHITSHYAKAIGGIDQVDFWGNVVIRHVIASNQPETIIKTSTLTVYPNKQIAQTNDPITLAQPNTLIKAVGMFADMNSGNIKLLSETRGEYVPSS